MYLNLKIRAFGPDADPGHRVRPLDYPVAVCDGCLIARTQPCPFTEPPLYTGNPCNIAQDVPSTAAPRTSSVCPPVVSSDAARPRAPIPLLMRRSPRRSMTATTTRTCRPPAAHRDPAHGQGRRDNHPPTPVVRSRSPGQPRRQARHPSQRDRFHRQQQRQGGRDHAGQLQPSRPVCCLTGRDPSRGGSAWASPRRAGTPSRCPPRARAVPGQAVRRVQLDAGPTLIVTSPAEGQLQADSVHRGDRDGAFGLAAPPTTSVGRCPAPVWVRAPPTPSGAASISRQNALGPQLLTSRRPTARRPDRGVPHLRHRQRSDLSPGPRLFPARLWAAWSSIAATSGTTPGCSIVGGGGRRRSAWHAPVRAAAKPAGGGIYTMLFDTGRLTRCRSRRPRRPTCIVFPTSRSAPPTPSATRPRSATTSRSTTSAAGRPESAANRQTGSVDRVYRCSWEFDPLAATTISATCPTMAASCPRSSTCGRASRIRERRRPGSRLTPMQASTRTRPRLHPQGQRSRWWSTPTGTDTATPSTRCWPDDGPRHRAPGAQDSPGGRSRPRARRTSPTIPASPITR